jgi:predicted sulfurtransferase
MKINLSEPEPTLCTKCKTTVTPKYFLQNGVPTSSACPECNNIFEYYGFIGILAGVFKGIKTRLFR